MNFFLRSSALVAFSLSLAACGGSASGGSGVSTQDHLDDSQQADAPIANFHQVRDGIYRGGHPSSAGLDYLQKIGVKTIIDLEVEDFIEAFPWEISDEIDGAKARGIVVIRHPMSAFEAGQSDRFDNEMNEMIATLADPSQMPIYVHCKHGQDRTGLVIGLERVFDEGWAPQDAHDEMVKIGFHTMFAGLEDYFERKTGWSPDSAGSGDVDAGDPAADAGDAGADPSDPGVDAGDPDADPSSGP